MVDFAKVINQNFHQALQVDVKDICFGGRGHFSKVPQWYDVKIHNSKLNSDLVWVKSIREVEMGYQLVGKSLVTWANSWQGQDCKR